MNEIKEMNKEITLYTCIMATICAVAGWIVFKDFLVFLGVIIGAVTGLAGYYMIIQMALNLSGSEKEGKRTGITNYVIRYLVYGLIFAGSVFYLKVSILALLVGMLSHKGSIYVYSILKKRKEDENGSN